MSAQWVQAYNGLEPAHGFEQRILMTIHKQVQLRNSLRLQRRVSILSIAMAILMIWMMGFTPIGHVLYSIVRAMYTLLAASGAILTALIHALPFALGGMIVFSLLMLLFSFISLLRFWVTSN